MVEKGAKRLSQIVLGASHLAQSVVAPLLTPRNSADEVALRGWKQNLRQTLEKQAHILCEALSQIDFLGVIRPQGSMYAMVRVDRAKLAPSIQDDVSFTQLLLEEENVFVLPGQAFGAACTQSHFFFRVVFCVAESSLQEAASRIEEFCNRHFD